MRPILVTLVLFCAFPLGVVRADTPPATAPPTSAATSKPKTEHNYSRWEKEVAGYETRDRKNQPPKNGIIFIGSSSIARWKMLADDFPGQPVINRGFGGTEIVDSTYYADRLIFPHQPKMVLLRAGGNDIHAGKSATQVFGDFKDFVAKVRTKLPDATIVFISQSPAPSRWAERDEDKKLNTLVDQWIKDESAGAAKGVKYVETYDISITPDGKPREELFVADRLHFNADGYKLLTEKVKPFLPAKE